MIKITFTCPLCLGLMEYKTPRDKGLAEYNADNVPNDVAQFVNGGGIRCIHCKEFFAITLKPSRVELLLVNYDPAGNIL